MLQNAMNQRAEARKPFGVPLGFLVFLLFLPFIIVVLLLRSLAGLFLHLAVWCCWCARGRYVLFVYSDSPIWRDYIEELILPRLGDRAVVLNWSHRSRWRRTLSVLAFRYFGGDRDFNPMAVVFRPFRLAQRFRFHEPFHEFKHGKTEAVLELERQLYAVLDEIAKPPAA